MYYLTMYLGKRLHMNRLGKKFHMPHGLGKKLNKPYNQFSSGLDKAAKLSRAVAPGAAILAPEFAPVILGSAAALNAVNTVNKSGNAVGQHVHNQQVAKRNARRNR